MFNSVLGENERVMEGATVTGSVIMGECVIREGATVEYAIIDRDTEIGKGARVGEPRAAGHGIAVLGTGVRVAENAVVAGGEMKSE